MIGDVLQALIDGLRHGVAAVMAVTAWPILIYFILINTSFLVLIGLAALEFARHMRRMPFADLEAVAQPADPAGLGPGAGVQRRGRDRAGRAGDAGAALSAARGGRRR